MRRVCLSWLQRARRLRRWLRAFRGRLLGKHDVILGPKLNNVWSPMYCREFETEMFTNPYSGGRWKDALPWRAAAAPPQCL